MSLLTRLMVTFLVLAGLGLYEFTVWVFDDFRYTYLASMEEPMVDTANLLAAMVAGDMGSGAIPIDGLRTALKEAQGRRLSAKIHEMLKTSINMRVYVTDAKGIVLYDSDGGREEGKDYSRWNDVARTLRGEYGARASRKDPDIPMSSILCVAAPILADGKTVGVLTVCKPADSIGVFIDTARNKVLLAGESFAVAVAILGILVSIWITRPLYRLTQYALAVRDGKRPLPPRLGRGEIGTLGAAFEEMRISLEGKKYVEEYVQSLTHQMKSPLSAIRGSAELLEESMPEEQRRRFTDNIRSEAGRLQNIVDRMLELAAVENRRELKEVESIDLLALASELVQELRSLLGKRQVSIDCAGSHPPPIQGERFLLWHALRNLVQNAIDFTGENGRISIEFSSGEELVEVSVIDDGAGIPEYALDRVFDRFYSLQRPGNGHKSSGLGLAFAREALALHGGTIRLKNRPEGGAAAVITLPIDAQ